MGAPSARDSFITAASRADSEIDLGRAALYIAAEERPEVDVEACVRRIDALAASVSRPLAAFRSAHDAIAEMRQLFTRERFTGNTRDYFDPRNSFLDQVLERRVGIPITLSIVYLEIGWRCGLPLAGVGFPGHFLVKYVSPGEEMYVDPFEGARPVSRLELSDRLTRMFGADTRLLPEHLAATPRRQILVRLNANLKAIYTDRGDLARALAAVERILALAPEAHEELRDRGLLYLGLHSYARASDDLRRYLELEPAAQDADEVRQLLEVASRERVRLN
jgi:regulator of sirC expression with transglutaminase-like and TPR domain